MKMSKTLIRILIASVIMAVTLSTSVGYAVLSNELNISGKNNANKQSGIFITDAKIASNVGADLTNSSVIQNGGCILTVNSALSETNTSSTLTYAVTFYNSTNDYYVYNTNSNTLTNKDYLTYSISKITKKETIIQPKGYITCNMVFNILSILQLQTLQQAMELSHLLLPNVIKLLMKTSHQLPAFKRMQILIKILKLLWIVTFQLQLMLTAQT